MRRAVLLLALLTACGGADPRRPDGGNERDGGAHDASEATDGEMPHDAAVDGDTNADASVPHPLGMNDITILVPLPAGGDTPTLLRMAGDGTGGADLVPADLFARLVTTPGDVGQAFGTFHVVAIRFDLCDRIAPGPCAPGEDGRMRLVFQPVTAGGSAVDTALHGFYPIAAADLPAVIEALRGLSVLQGTAVGAPLQVSPALRAADHEAYATALRSLVRTYAKSDTLMRLTLFSQKQFSQISEWVLRGVVRTGETWNDIVVPDVAATGQHVILVPGEGDPTYTVEPTADAPAGFGLTLAEAAFGAADADAKNDALQALVQIEDPDLHTAETVQCASCHVSTVLLARRALAAGTTAAAVPGQYSSAYNLSIAEGESADDKVSLRALGWFGTSPKISQRVVNDTAQVLGEMATRFGGAP